MEFNARFGGVSHRIRVPVDFVLGIYARETGQGMVFTEEGSPVPGAAGNSSDGGGPDPTPPPPGQAAQTQPQSGQIADRKTPEPQSGDIRTMGTIRTMRTAVSTALIGLLPLAALAAAAPAAPSATPPAAPDFSQVQIRVTRVAGDLYALEGQGGTVSVLTAPTAPCSSTRSSRR